MEIVVDLRARRTPETPLVTQTSLPVILVGSAIYPFGVLSLREWGILYPGSHIFKIVP